MAKTRGKEQLQTAGRCRASNRSTGRPSLLSEEQKLELRRDLSSPPERFGLDAADWSGTQLARHIARRYGVRMSARHCRRILMRSAPRTNRNLVAPPPGAASLPNPPRSMITQRLSPYPNLFAQQDALRRLRRMASSGLSTVEFANGAFDVVADAIPNTECKAFHLSGTTPTVWWPWITRNIDRKWAPDYQRYVTERSTEERGVIDPMTARQKPVYRHEELVTENWERTETYNELYRHWGFHHVLYVWAMDGGEFVGGLPIWRSYAMRPFTNDDARFANAASTLIGHALTVARGLESRHVEGEEFFAPKEPSTGVVLISEEGRILAIDQAVREIFGKIAVFDGISERLLGQRLAPFMRYLARTLGRIFSRHSDGGKFLEPPGACLYLHRSGVALRFHGFLAESEQGKGYYSVLVQAGELAEHRRRRLMLRYGLSPREFDVLRVIGQGKRGRDAAGAMRVEQGTFYKYARQVSEKLGSLGSPSLRDFARKVGL